MEGQVYLLYEADAYLSYDSMVLMGVFSNDEDMLDAVRTLAKSRLDDDINAYNDDEDIDTDDMTEDEIEATKDEIIEEIIGEFCGNFQTQNYENNFYATEVTLNELNENGIR